MKTMHIYIRSLSEYMDECFNLLLLFHLTCLYSLFSLFFFALIYQIIYCKCYFFYSALKLIPLKRNNLGLTSFQGVLYLYLKIIDIFLKKIISATYSKLSKGLEISIKIKVGQAVLELLIRKQH